MSTPSTRPTRAPPTQRKDNGDYHRRQRHPHGDRSDGSSHRVDRGGTCRLRIGLGWKRIHAAARDVPRDGQFRGRRGRRVAVPLCCRNRAVAVDRRSAVGSVRASPADVARTGVRRGGVAAPGTRCEFCCAAVDRTRVQRNRVGTVDGGRRQLDHGVVGTWWRRGGIRGPPRRDEPHRRIRHRCGRRRCAGSVGPVAARARLPGEHLACGDRLGAPAGPRARNAFAQ